MNYRSPFMQRKMANNSPNTIPAVSTPNPQEKRLDPASVLQVKMANNSPNTIPAVSTPNPQEKRQDPASVLQVKMANNLSPNTIPAVSTPNPKEKRLDPYNAGCLEEIAQSDKAAHCGPYFNYPASALKRSASYKKRGPKPAHSGVPLTPEMRNVAEKYPRLDDP